MSLPTPPLALTPAYLSVLQARQAPSPPAARDTAATPRIATPTASPPKLAGRGRLIDILA